MEEDIVSSCRDLAASILSEGDARTRMQHCRRAIGLGRQAVKYAEGMSGTELLEVQDTLRLAFRASRGTYNPNASITKLAKLRMERAGIMQLPIVSATESRIIGTDTACLAVSDEKLSEKWFETQHATAAMNAEDFALMGVGADGSYSICIRLIDADDHYLESSEYKKVVEVSPPVAIKIRTERVFFGAAEAVEDGVGFRIANGRYICSVTSLRSGRHLRFIATLIRSDEPVPEVHQLPEFREV